MAAGNSEQFAYEFERPLVDYDKRVAALRENADKDDAGARAEIEAIEKERDELAQQICASLTPYQRVKLARHPFI